MERTIPNEPKRVKRRSLSLRPRRARPAKDSAPGAARPPVFRRADAVFRCSATYRKGTVVAMGLSLEPRQVASKALIYPVALLFFIGCSGQTVVESSDDDGDTGSPGLLDAGSADGGGGTDAGAVADAAADANEGGIEVPCPMDWGATAEVVGTTPSGPFKGQYAWMGFMGGECGGIRIAVTETPELKPEAQLPAPPVLFFGAGANTGSSFEGAGETYVTFQTASEEIYTKGWVDLSRVDPWPPSDSSIDPANYPRAEGTISVEGDGISLKGSFTAPYCAHMNIYCP
jgi:hypothetical protein